MTRSEILEKYTVENGKIKSLGKFEGEKIYTPYFYDLLLNGDGEENGGGNVYFEILPEDIKEFPELKGKKIVEFTETDNGFFIEL